MDLKSSNTDELLLSVLTRRTADEEQQDAAQKRIRKRYNVLFANSSVCIVFNLKLKKILNFL